MDHLSKSTGAKSKRSITHLPQQLDAFIVSVCASDEGDQPIKEVLRFLLLGRHVLVAAQLPWKRREGRLAWRSRLRTPCNNRCRTNTGIQSSIPALQYASGFVLLCLCPAAAEGARAPGRNRNPPPPPQISSRNPPLIRMVWY